MVSEIYTGNKIKMSVVSSFLSKILGGSSLTLALIYTCGHIIIAATVVYIMTGASLWEAGSVALVEPAINGIWFFVLHRLWKKFR